MHNHRRFFTALALSASATAGASHSIYSPEIEAGEFALELSSHRDSDSDSAVDGQWDHRVDLEFAPFDWWRTEATARLQHRDSESPETTAIEWENIFRLTTPGKYWLDAGLAVEYSHSLEDDGHDALEIGALLQKTVGRAVSTLNVFAEREFGGDGEIEFEYAARFLWRGNESFAPAVEAYGELEEGAHSLGPGAVGTWQIGEEARLGYEFAVLRGLGSDAPDWTLRFAFEIEM